MEKQAISMLQTKDKSDFLSSYNQNLKINIFTPLATAKVGLAHYDSFHGGGSQMKVTITLHWD